MDLRERATEALAAIADPLGGGNVVATARAAGVVVRDDGKGGSTIGLVLGLDGEPALPKLLADLGVTLQNPRPA